MKRIDQGQYEVFTTKEDAIDKFKQMQGICREKINSENLVGFYCSKKGKIKIRNPHPLTRRAEWARVDYNSTNLYGKIVEQDDKTYIIFYTKFSKINHASKLVFFTSDVLIVILAIIIDKTHKIPFVIFFVAYLAFLIFQLFITGNEKPNASKDSEILIKELEKRVDAVNQWDK